MYYIYAVLTMGKFLLKTHCFLYRCDLLKKIADYCIAESSNMATIPLISNTRTPID
jgi:hypothetical protein